MKPLRKQKSSKKPMTIETISAISIKDLEDQIKKKFNKRLKDIQYQVMPKRMHGKNELCFCNSGKLYKRCCIEKKLPTTYLVYIESDQLSASQIKPDFKTPKHETLNLPLQKDFPKAREISRGILDSEKPKPPSDSCPICGEPVQFWASSYWQERFCKNRHCWHYCLLHNTVVLGPPNYSLSKDSCSCGKNNLVK